MRKILLIGLLLGTACSSKDDKAKMPEEDGSAQGAAPAATSTPEAAIRAYEQAMISRDSAAVAAVWDEGQGADTGARTSTLKQIMVPGTDRMDSVTRMSGPEINVIGDSATSSGKVVVYGNENGKDLHRTANFTYSLRKRDGGWKITAAAFDPID
jgi:ketosteroid isomerase-like protein